MRSPIMLICGAIVCALAGCNSTYESSAKVSSNPKSAHAQGDSSAAEERHGNDSAKLDVGTKLDVALATLDSAGATNESVWQWGGFDETTEATWRDISEGITLAIHFNKSTKNITALQMMYIPANYNARGNYRIVDVQSIQFHVDKSYTVHFGKPK